MKEVTHALVAVLWVTIIQARPQESPKDAKILTYHHKDTEKGYELYVKTSDGFQHQQDGELRKTKSGATVLTVTGHYLYLGPDGKTYEVQYVADENGFRPLGPHLHESASVVKDFPVGDKIGSKTITTLGGGVG